MRFLQCLAFLALATAVFAATCDPLQGLNTFNPGCDTSTPYCLRTNPRSTQPPVYEVTQCTTRTKRSINAFPLRIICFLSPFSCSAPPAGPPRTPRIRRATARPAITARSPTGTKRPRRETTLHPRVCRDIAGLLVFSLIVAVF